MHPDDPFDQKLTQKRPDTPPSDVASSERTIGRHRAPERPRRGVRALLTSAPARVALATGVSCCLGVAAIAVVRTDDAPREPLAEAVAERAAAADQAASRSLDRATSP
ncbi:hypothetical protein DLJ47_31545, partial [Micromonospora sp. S4605]